MMEVGWSSFALERYAWHRFGEDIPASTFRSFKAKSGIVARGDRFSASDPDALVDVVSARADLIRLQQARVAIDWEHERAMKKLFSNNRAEIALLGALLTEHRVDLQDLGLLPKAGEMLEVRALKGSEELPRHRSLADALGEAGVSEATERQLARVLHMAVPPLAVAGSVDGGGVSGNGVGNGVGNGSGIGVGDSGSAV
jgi:hypothetical protein